MISVMGATGHTGGEIARLLLAAGQKVRVLGRSEERLSKLASAGAETLVGEATDAAYLSRAFAGAEAVYTLLPPDPQSTDYPAKQKTAGEATVRAIRESGVRYVVFLSSVGADQAAGTGPIAGLHHQEERLRRMEGANVLILRPGSFFENFYQTLGLIKHQGINGGAVGPEVVLSMVATRDIAQVAAKALQERDWKGVVIRELLGPRDLTYAEATRILGERLGKPDLKYVQFPYEELAKALVQMGLSENMAGLYAEMSRAFNEGRVKSRAGRKAESTTPTRFEDFAGELSLAYQAL